MVKVISQVDGNFNGPTDVSSDGTNVWIINNPTLVYGTSNESNDFTVSQLNASTGKLVQVISQIDGSFNSPFGISSDGNNVWVTNQDNSTVTQIFIPS